MFRVKQHENVKSGATGNFFRIIFIILIIVTLVNMKYPSKAKAEKSPSLNRPKVIRVYSEKAVDWDYKTEPSLDFANQEIINNMLDEGLKELTGRESIDQAWRDILSSYKPGDKVAIKPNFNTINHGYKKIFTSPQVINAVIKGLVESLGIPEENIYIYDLCKIIPDDILRNRIPYSVNYVQGFQLNSIWEKIQFRMRRLFDSGLDLPDTSAPVRMREKVVDEQENPVTQHLINIPLLTNHIYLLASGPLKNHFGTVRFSNYNRYPSILHGKILEKSIVDLNLNPHIKDKTRLIVYDALWGVYSRGEDDVKRKWETFPADNLSC
jgi:hypothetical protein